MPALMGAQPSVSIVVVTHNEGERLRQTVAGLAATAPQDFEVIVVDDFSTDGSIELLQASQPDARVVRPPQRLGPPAAKNFGARLAAGSVIVWSDAHVDPVPGWASSLTAVLADPKVGAAGPGVTAIGSESNAGFGMRWKNAALEMQWLGRAGDEPYPVPIICSCFMAMRREVFEQTGGFDPGLIMWGGGEMELCYRLWSLGYECRIAPQAQIAHLFRPAFPYAVSAVDVLHNQLRTPIIHFDRDRLAGVLAALGKNPVFPRAMALVLDGDIWSRRADLQARRILDDQAYFDRFPTPGLSQPAPASEAVMSDSQPSVNPSIMIPPVHATVQPTFTPGHPSPPPKPVLPSYPPVSPSQFPIKPTVGPVPSIFPSKKP